MRILVTGGAGFIGANLVKALLAKNIEVTILDNLATGSVDNLTGLECEVITGSILDLEILKKSIVKADRVIHLAALPSVPRSLVDPIATNNVNVCGTLNVLNIAKDFGIHTIVASSSSVYGKNPVMPKKEDMELLPASPYAVSKLATEHYALAFQDSYGLKTLAFRFFNVFGPLQSPNHAYAAVIPSFLYSVLKKKPVLVHGDGKQSRDFTFVETVCEVLAVSSINQLHNREAVNLAFGTNINLIEVIEFIKKYIDPNIEINFTEPRVGDVKHSQAANESLTKLVPDLIPTSFVDGLIKTWEWFQTAKFN